jgi:hypothetical protein
MERALTIEDGKVIIVNEKGISFGNRIIIKSFLRILAKIARPLLVSITAQLVIAAMNSSEEADAFLQDVLEEVDGNSN